MRVSAKADYAVRAAVELAAADRIVKAERLAEAQRIPLNFLENILGELRHARVIVSRRGPDGGHRLARPADEISVADVMRAVEGPLATVRGEPPEELHYSGSAAPLQDVWVALRSNVRAVLETVTLHDLVERSLPAAVAELARDPEAWAAR